MPGNEAEVVEIDVVSGLQDDFRQAMVGLEIVNYFVDGKPGATVANAAVQMPFNGKEVTLFDGLELMDFYERFTDNHSLLLSDPVGTHFTALGTAVGVILIEGTGALCVWLKVVLAFSGDAPGLAAIHATLQKHSGFPMEIRPAPAMEEPAGALLWRGVGKEIMFFW
jgi:hypothetical protein